MMFAEWLERWSECRNFYLSEQTSNALAYFYTKVTGNADPRPVSRGLRVSSDKKASK